MSGLRSTQQQVDTIKWQDYRGSATGMVVYYSSDPVSEIPIREIPEEIDSPVLPDPNYETGTYGMYGCVRPKVRNTFIKNKCRYLFFMTRYAGIIEDYQEKVVVTGYFRIAKIADAKKFHIRYCPEFNCLDTDTCPALRADEVHFVSLEDAVIVDDVLLKQWGYSSKITRQTRIMLDEEQAGKLITCLGAHSSQLDAYINETSRLQPHEQEMDFEEEEDDDGETVVTGADDTQDEV